ncbi:hypothetical protein I8E17_07640 [Rhizobium sp. AB2/73]|nr:hypothetical protein [Rhizobium sp. AB2/73]UEQ82358.1 hypothetical protein I8E17_07640 [Rhizobium sp. AB2/73]
MLTDFRYRRKIICETDIGMDANQIPSDKMREDALKALETVANGWIPGSIRHFERSLAQAVIDPNVNGFEALSLAYSALTVADAGVDDALQHGWYVDKAMSLMRRAMDSFSLLAASQASQAAVN